MEVVRLKQLWHGHPAGTILKVKGVSANMMYQSDAAEKIETESKAAIKDKLQCMAAVRRLNASKK